ncbi:hypothetical protein JW898_05455 [Candidatus Woesearchaeota archaeon]|nr:hypothetical protein [Candidatus Woesearchaeota archaeon]
MVNVTQDREVKLLLSSLGAALRGLSERGIDPGRALKLACNDRGIPVSIFNPELGALESIVKYMREELLLDYRTIASMLGRNEGPVGVTYRRSLKKSRSRLDITSKESIPFDALRANSKIGLSVFESIAYHLAKQGRGWHEIANIMHRHDKTVWTVLDRAKKKMRKATAR